MRRFGALLAVGWVLVLMAAGSARAVAVAPVAPQLGIWLTQGEIATLPTSGPAYDAVRNDAYASWPAPNIADQNDNTDVMALAGGLIYQRTGDSALRAKVAQTVMAARGSEQGARALALGRNLVGYVLAADLINLHDYSPTDDQAFRSWLTAVRTEPMTGGPANLIDCHNSRPNNWGAHAGASRIAADLYLGDRADLAKAATVFAGWLGDRSAYAGFTFGDLSWQSDSAHPVAINPAGATIQGHNVDGVLPDDQRRAGPYSWPPPKENYVWEALQGATVQAYLLNRAGYDTFNWSHQALLRATTWLYDVDQFPATGDDTWQPWLINYAYNTHLPTTTPTQPGKNAGYTDWTLAARTLGTTNILGSAPLTPGAAPTTAARGPRAPSAPTASARVPLAVGLRLLAARHALRTGRLLVRVHCAARCTMRLTATLGGHRHARLATRRAHLRADQRATVALRLRRHALARLRRATVVVTIDARSPSGAARRMRRSALLTR